MLRKISYATEVELTVSPNRNDKSSRHMGTSYSGIVCDLYGYLGISDLDI